MDVVNLTGDEHRAYLVPVLPPHLAREPSAPTRIEITGTEGFMIGRAPHNDFSVNDGTVSRLHCRIVCRDDDYLVRDLRSASGYRIEGPGYSGRSGGWHHLLDGDTLYVGQIPFKFFREPSRDTLEARLTLWYPAELVTLDGHAHHVFIPLLSAAHRPGDHYARPSGSGDEATRALYSGERHFQVALADGFTSSWPLSWIRRLVFGPLTKTN